MDSTQQNPKGYYIDKRITITAVVMVIFSYALMYYKVDELDRRTSNNTQVLERLVRVETQVVAVKESLLRIEENLNRRIEP